MVFAAVRQRQLSNTSLVVAGVLMHFYASRIPLEVLSFIAEKWKLL